MSMFIQVNKKMEKNYESYIQYLKWNGNILLPECTISNFDSETNGTIQWIQTITGTCISCAKIIIYSDRHSIHWSHFPILINLLALNRERKSVLLIIIRNFMAFEMRKGKRPILRSYTYFIIKSSCIPSPYGFWHEPTTLRLRK